MLARAVNGYTNTQIDDAIKGKTTTMQRRFRFEILDSDNNLIRETDNIIGGSVKHVANQRIKRGGSVNIRHQPFTLTTNYVTPGQSGTDLLMSTFYTQAINESAILYWRLGDTSGSTAADASGNSRTGTYQNSPTLNQESGLAGDTTNGSTKFNGTNQYVSRASESAMNASAFTWEIWFKSSDTSATLVDRDDGSSNRYARFEIDSSGYLNAGIRFTTGVYTNFTATAKVNDNKWHHAVLTYNGSYVVIYCDGKRILKTAETRTMTSPTIALNIGRNNAAANYFDGYLDEFVYYAYALTSAQVRARYQAGSNNLFEIDYLRDRLKIYCAVKMPTAGTDGTYWAEYSLGIFVFGTPRKIKKEAGIEYQSQIFDQSYILDRQKISARYTVTSGTNYQTAITTVLAAANFSTSFYSISATSSTLPADRSWNVGTSRLQIINDLLSSINFRELHFDGNGVGIGESYTLPSSRASEYSYTADANSILVNTFELSTNINETFNVVTIGKTNPKGDILSVTVKNLNISHPTSVPSLLELEIVYYDLNVDAVDITALTGLANRKLTELSEVYLELRRETPIVPFHDDYDKITITDDTHSISADFLEYEWEIPLEDFGLMKHLWRYVLAVV